MKLEKVRNRNEDKLRGHLYKKGRFSVRVAKQPRKEFKLRLIAEEARPVTFDNFQESVDLFGPRLIGTFRRPARFDLVAKTIPRRAKVYIIELKAGGLAFRDIHQLLGYINLVRHLQQYGGKVGLHLLSKALNFPVTPYTKICGLLIGKSVRNELLAWMPEEFWDVIKLCVFRVVDGKWPNNIQRIRIYDKWFSFRQDRRKSGRKLYEKLNAKLA